MRIISNFRDYYDGAMRQGMDKDVVYVREKKEINIGTKYVLGYSWRSTGYYAELHLLGYCGKIYHVFEIAHANEESVFYYNYEDFKIDALKVGAISKWDVERRRWWPSQFQKFLDQDLSVASEIFHKSQVPLFLISLSSQGRDQVLTLNPNLKKLDFQKIKDTYTAYQDIFQYVSGVLNSRENYMVKITDKDKIAKHGFDKWSFRKLPGSKKRHK